MKVVTIKPWTLVFSMKMDKVVLVINATAS